MALLDLTSQSHPKPQKLSSARPSFTIRPAAFPQDKYHVMYLLRALVLGMSLSPELEARFLTAFENDAENIPEKYTPRGGGGVWLAFLPLPVHDEGENERDGIEGDKEGKPAGIVFLKSINTSGIVDKALSLDPTAQLEDASTEVLNKDPEINGEGRMKLRKRSCELKRLFIINEARHLGLGRRLVEAVYGEARRFGCEQILLETPKHAFNAIKL